MKTAIQNGLFSENSVVLDTQPACSSGNCTWPSYRSLAICARSADVTSYLQTKEVSVRGDLPGQPKHNELRWYLSKQNYLQDNIYSLSNLSSAAKLDPIYAVLEDPISGEQETDNPISLDFSDSIAFKDSALPVADVFMIYTNTTEFKWRQARHLLCNRVCARMVCTKLYHLRHQRSVFDPKA